MRIVDAKWTPVVNMLIIDCECTGRISHRADRWNVRCIWCGNRANLTELRARYLEENGRATR